MKSDKIEQIDKNEEMSEFNNFSEAKKNYIAFKSIGDEHFEGLHHSITDYVSELEQQKAELILSIESIQNIITVDELNLLSKASIDCLVELVRIKNKYEGQ